MKLISQQKLRRAFESLAAELCVDFTADEGCIVIDREEAERHRGAFLDDPNGLEAFVNHVHVEDLLAGALRPTGRDRAALDAIGIALLRVWAERLHRSFPEQPAIFYLGGTDSVSLRFHLHRPDAAPWVALDDLTYLRNERVSVWLLDAKGELSCRNP
jgi:hypothetical protein